MLFDLMPQLGWTARPNGYIDFYNRGWYEYTGTTFEQMQGWGWEAVHDPEMLPKVAEQWQRSLESGAPFEMEFPLRRHDGVFRWFLTRVNPLRDADGEILRWIGINTDIDERRHHARMLERLSHVGRTISADLELENVLQAVTDAATELSGAHFGAFFYNVLNEAGEAYMLYTISGVAREHFEKFPMPRNTAIFAPTFAGEATVVIDDVHKDPRFGKNAPYHGMPEGHLPVVSYLAVPVVSRSGEVLGGLFFGHPRAGVFTLQSAQVVEGLAAQAAVTLDNARLYQRVVADRALVRHSEARYRTLVESSPTAQAVGTCNPEGYVVEDSPSWRALTGQTFEQMRGRGWLDAVHPDFREATERELDAAIAARRIYLMEFRLRMSDRTYRWFASKGVPVYDEDGTLREWIGTTSDIDQRRSTEEHLRFLARANELFASSLDYESTLRNLAQTAVPALADWCTVNMATKSADGTYERLAIAHLDAEKADLAWEMYQKYTPNRPVDPVAQAIRSGKSQLVREINDDMLRNMSASEDHYAGMKQLGLVSWMVVPLPGRRGPLGAVTFASSDSMRLFTELDLSYAEEFARQAAVAIENAVLYRDAQDANRAKDDFLATLSHELRTPMTAILGWSRVLEEGGLDDDTFGSAIESIVHSAQAQALLIEDVLDMSRIIAGKMQMDPQPVDLADVVQAAIRTVQPAAEAKGVILETQRRPGASLVTGDPNRLQQIVWNLLSNAIKFTPRGGEVVARIEQSGSFVRLTVRDSGKGIRPEFLPHVFEPFRQAENVTTRTHGGLGLGLAIARQLVELHGGNISARSDGEGKGAAFVIELPIRAVRTIDLAQPASLEPSAKRRRNAQTDAAYPSLAGVQVLVVDDQDDARVLVRTVLARCGADVTTAASVRDAVEHLEAGAADIIVSDIAMPDADGFELIRHIRESRMLATPVIAMTAFGHPSDQEKILAAGFTGYLKKPVEPVDFVRELHAVLQRSRGGST
ncbi:MAG TPA: PAS domain-containing protein [Thermoanaerobaculia bacterium]